MSRHTVTIRGFKVVTTRAEADVIHHEDGWSNACHPVTGAILQRNPNGYLTVHTDQGSWDTGSNTTTTIIALWKGR